MTTLPQRLAELRAKAEAAKHIESLSVSVDTERLFALLAVVEAAHRLISGKTADDYYDDRAALDHTLSALAKTRQP